VKTFRELLVKCDFQKVLEFLKSITYEVNNVDKFNEGYILVFDHLKQLQSTENEFVKIIVKSELDPTCDTGSFHGDITLMDNKDKIFSSDFVKWSELIDQPVETQYGNIETLAYLLYDITFYGFNPETIEEEFDNIKLSLDESLKSLKLENEDFNL
jgi:hypothetical protein